MERSGTLKIISKCLTTFFLSLTFHKYSKVDDEHAIYLLAFELKDELPKYCDGYTNYMKMRQAPYFDGHLFWFN
jgi:hypothetical protein